MPKSSPTMSWIHCFRCQTAVDQARCCNARIDVHSGWLCCRAAGMHGRVVRVATRRVWLLRRTIAFELLAHRLGQRMQVPESRTSGLLLLLDVRTPSRAESGCRDRAEASCRCCDWRPAEQALPSLTMEFLMLICACVPAVELMV